MTAPPLSRRVRVSYSLGSVVTGAFGTVPGLLLLPYLTGTVGVAAGLLVLLPKAWDVLVNPVAGAVRDGVDGVRSRTDLTPVTRATPAEGCGVG